MKPLTTIFKVGARVRHRVTDETGEVVKSRLDIWPDRVAVLYDDLDQVYETAAHKLVLE